MKTNPWQDIKPSDDNVSPPNEVIAELFSGLRDFSSDKVDFKLDTVNFFPEEIRYSSSLTNTSFHVFSNEKMPHPDFGYNPQAEKNEEFFRYRLLLSPNSKPRLRYELFKFKYPILFYPVTFYIEKDSFNLLEKNVSEKGEVVAVSVQDLEAITTDIIKSESTKKLITRLMTL